MGRVLVGSDVASYVPMESVQTAVTIDPRSGARATLNVSFSLDAPERAARQAIAQRRLWLRAAYSETLLLYGGRMYRWGAVPDLDRLAQLLQEDTDRLLGPGRAEVLLDTVLIHAG